MSNDPSSKFERARVARAGVTNRNTVDKATAQERRDARHDEWVGDRRTGRDRPHLAAGGGLVLDPATIDAKQKMDAERAKQQPAPQVDPSPVSADAIARSWMSDHPEFYPSEFNRTSLGNLVQKNLDEGNAPHAHLYEVLTASYEWLLQNNHLERDPNIQRKRGEVIDSSAPTLFEYETPQQAQERADEIDANQKLAREREIAAAKVLPFDQLKAQVQGARKPLTREQVARMQERA